MREGREKFQTRNRPRALRAKENAPPTKAGLSSLEEIASSEPDARTHYPSAQKKIASRCQLRRQQIALYAERLRLRHFLFMHSLRHPLASHVEKLVPKKFVFGESSKPHALARVANAIVVDGGH